MCDVGSTNQPLSRSDVQGAGILLTSVLSIIFYARSAFPADCFQVVLDSQLRDPNVTHATLVTSGTPLPSVESTRDVVLSEGGPFLYMRKSDNPRMNKFLGTLDQIFVFLRKRRLGKIQFCLTSSKTWDRDSLLEFYSLKFSYTKLGSVHIYVDWGGDSVSCSSMDENQPVRAFLQNLSPLVQPFFMHPFLYSIDGKSLSGITGSGLSQSVKETVAVLQHRKGAGVGRIGKFIYYSPAETAAEIFEFREAENRRKKDARKRKESVLEVVKSLSFRKTTNHRQAASPESQPFEEQGSTEEASQQTQSTLLCSTPPDYEMPLWMSGEQKLKLFASPLTLSMTDLSRSKKSELGCHNSLMVHDEGPEDMPPTQPPGDPTGLLETQIGDRRCAMASSLKPPSSYLSMSTKFQGQF